MAALGQILTSRNYLWNIITCGVVFRLNVQNVGTIYHFVSGCARFAQKEYKAEKIIFDSRYVERYVLHMLKYDMKINLDQSEKDQTSQLFRDLPLILRDIYIYIS